jgi:vitamin-K-epoxide reductase (warfarin-sensitive)
MRNWIMRGTIAALALAGMVVSGLALRVHFMDPGAAPPCAVSEHWDCGAVNHSRFAVFPPVMSDEAPGKMHIPVAAIGIAGYGLMLVLALMGRLWAVLQMAEIGFAAACMLSYLEAFVLETWCIYCVWSQAIVTAILLATIVALAVRRRKPAADEAATVGN